jgi:hypothetical protein
MLLPWTILMRLRNYLPTFSTCSRLGLSATYGLLGLSSWPQTVGRNSYIEPPHMRVVSSEPDSNPPSPMDDSDECMPQPSENSPPDLPQFQSAREGARYFLQKILAARDETKP